MIRRGSCRGPLRIGRLLANHVAPTEREERFRDPSTSLTAADPSHLTGRTREVAELKLIAQAREGASAYAYALTYLTAGAARCGTTRGSARQDLAFAL